MARYVNFTCGCAPFRGCHVPLQLPLPVGVRFSCESPFEKVTETEPLLNGAPQLSTTLACTVAGCERGTLVVGSVSVVGCTERLAEQDEDANGSGLAGSLPLPGAEPPPPVGDTTVKILTERTEPSEKTNARLPLCTPADRFAKLVCTAILA